MTDILLEGREVRVFHGRTEVVHGVSFEVPTAQVSAILGVNGAGKTSLMGGIVGTLSCSGAITFEGSRIDGLPPWQRSHLGIALVQEGRRLFHGMTVGENLGLAAWRRGRTKPEIAKQLALVCDLFPILERKSSHPASRLSGGEQQMLAVAQGIMTFPKLLILDEPTAGLAPKIVAQMLQAIQRLAREGFTTLIVEQSIANVRRVAQRVVIMKVGTMQRNLGVADLNDAIEAEYLR